MIKPSIDGSLTFMCLVEGIAPVLLSVGLPNSMLYADGAFTTGYLIFSVREAKPSVKVVLNSIYPLPPLGRRRNRTGSPHMASADRGKVVIFQKSAKTLHLPSSLGRPAPGGLSFPA